MTRSYYRQEKERTKLTKSTYFVTGMGDHGSSVMEIFPEDLASDHSEPGPEMGYYSQDSELDGVALESQDGMMRNLPPVRG